MIEYSFATSFAARPRARHAFINLHSLPIPEGSNGSGPPFGENVAACSVCTRVATSLQVFGVFAPFRVFTTERTRDAELFARTE